MKKSAGVILSALLAGAGVLSCFGTVSAAEEAEFTLDPIYVTATRYERKDLSIPASTEVFTREKLDLMDARSVMDVIANIPGFVMSESPSGNGYPGLRGITNHLSIERIEVVKGGSAVLYGSNATTGVINIITRKGDENRIKIGAGNNSQKLVSGYAGTKSFRSRTIITISKTPALFSIMQELTRSISEITLNAAIIHCNLIPLKSGILCSCIMKKMPILAL